MSIWVGGIFIGYVVNQTNEATYDGLVVGIMTRQASCVDDVGAIIIEGSILRSGNSLQAILIDFPQSKGYSIFGDLSKCGVHFKIRNGVGTDLLEWFYETKIYKLGVLERRAKILQKVIQFVIVFCYLSQ